MSEILRWLFDLGKYFARTLDWPLLLALGVLMGIGLAVLYSAGGETQGTHLMLAQGVNGLGAVTEVAEHVVCVLAKTRRNVPQPSGGITKFDTNTALPYRAERWILVLNHHLTIPDVRVIKRLFRRIHRSNTNIFIRQKGHPLIPRPLPENRL